MNKEGYNEYHNIGSVRDYFLKNSMGAFRPTFDVYGPVTISGTRESYGGVKADRNYAGARSALSEALDTLIKWGTVDFSKYDNDGDGVVDFVFMFYAGIGSNYSGNTKAIWPHAWVFSPSKYLGSNKRAYRYACSNEIDGSAYQRNPNTSVLGGIGTFAHEFGHVLGLPDMYDLEGNNPKITPKDWDVMDQGNYNCPSNADNSRNCTPPYLSAFERMSLGWMTPTELYAVGEVRLDKLDDNVAYSITNPENPDEIFLLEYRTKQNWDQGHKNSGILLWHIDYVQSVWTGKTVNNDGDHMHVDIEEAVPNTSSYTRASDVFPGTGNVREFEDFTFWDGSRAEVRIYDISESSDKTYALFNVDMEVVSSSSAEESSSSEAVSSSSEEVSSSSEEQSSSSEVESSSSDGGTGFAGKTITSGNVSVLRQGNSVLVQLSRRGKNTVRLFGLNGNAVYEKSFEGERIVVPLSANMGKQTFVLTVEQDGTLLTTRQIR
jgi:M6 family metalloprotease-like protein